MKKIIKPASIPFIIGLIIFTLIVVGGFSLSIIGIIKQNSIYILIGAIAFILTFVELIAIIKMKIVIFNDDIYIEQYKFIEKTPWQRNIITTIKIGDIEDISLSDYLLKFLIITDKNKKQYLIYIKPYSKKQINYIIDYISKKIQENS